MKTVLRVALQDRWCRSNDGNAAERPPPAGTGAREFYPWKNWRQPFFADAREKVTPGKPRRIVRAERRKGAMPLVTTIPYSASRPRISLASADQARRRWLKNGRRSAKSASKRSERRSGTLYADTMQLPGRPLCRTKKGNEPPNRMGAARRSYPLPSARAAAKRADEPSPAARATDRWCTAPAAIAAH